MRVLIKVEDMFSGKIKEADSKGKSLIDGYINYVMEDESEYDELFEYYNDLFDGEKIELDEDIVYLSEIK